ncbi:MAG: MATE family efflux transporter [Treponema sp.]|nr:MATE family efflux transporter [Treponema sp.]
MKSPQEEKMFTGRDLWRLIWPLAVEQMLQISLGIADIVMVAHIGEESVSGVSLVDQINVLLTQIFAALATGGAVVCSQYIGRGSRTMAEKTARQLIYTISGIALSLLLAGLFLHRPLLRAIFGQVTPGVMEASRRYFLITLFALPGTALYNACAALFRSRGNSAISMDIALLVNVINIGGNAILIYGLGWGVEGVAVPTLLSRTAAAAVLLVALYRDKSLSIKGISRVVPDWHLIGKILKIGIPNGLENSTFQIGKILVLSLIASFGTQAIAANAAANTVTSFEVLPGNACSLAMLTVVGQCCGAGKPEQASAYTKKLLLFAYAGFWLLNIPLLMLIGKIVSFYGMSEETTRLASCMALLHGAVGLFIWPLSFTLPNALRAAGDVAYTMLVSMISMWTVRIGMSYVFRCTGIFGMTKALDWPVSFGAMGVWFAMMMDWVVRSIAFVIRFAQGSWKSKRVI